MEIDLIKIAKLGLTINEYLTLVKLDKSNNGIDFPFTSTYKHLELLRDKGYITISEDEHKRLKFTEKGHNVIFTKANNVDFEEIFNLYPSETPSGRKLRAKTKLLGGKMTKGYAFLRDKYLLRVKTQEHHKQVVEATKAMLKQRSRDGSMDYLRKMEYYINGQDWEQYIDGDGVVSQDSNINEEKL